MTTYKLIKDPISDQVTSVLKDSGYFVPFDPANTDYQIYLEWLKIDGNVPEAAE